MLTLKTKNTPAVIAVSILNGGLVYFFVMGVEILSPEVSLFITTWKTSGLLAISAAPFIGAISLILPRHIKESLVYWRWPNAAPGFRAFSDHAHKDPRVDISRLKSHLPELENMHLSPKTQNKLWYRLYKQCESENSVAHAHGTWLLYRDLTSLSFIFLIALLFLLISKQNVIYWQSYLAIGFAELLIFTLSARTAGTQFIRNVLAIMSQPDRKAESELTSMVS